MVKSIIKKYYRRKIKSYLENIQTMSSEYREANSSNIDALVWLLAYYKDRAACTPKELLESILSTHARVTIDIEYIRTLYYWVYYKRIVGF